MSKGDIDDPANHSKASSSAKFKVDQKVVSIDSNNSKNSNTQRSTQKKTDNKAGSVAK